MPTHPFQPLSAAEEDARGVRRAAVDAALWPLLNTYGWTAIHLSLERWVDAPLPKLPPADAEHAVPIDPGPADEA